MRVELARAFGTFRRFVGENARTGSRRLEVHLGGPLRTQVILLLAAVLALNSADTATVGASATQLRNALHIDNTDIGLLVAVNAAVAAVASIPFGFVADRFRRTHVLAGSVFLWGGAMLWSATATSFGRLLLARLALGLVTASAGPVIASLIGDYFPSDERGRIYGYVLTGELAGAGVGFAVTGDVAALSWRLAFVILAIPTFILARFLLRLPEPVRGGLAPLQPQARDAADPGGSPGRSTLRTGPGTDRTLLLPTRSSWGPGDPGPPEVPYADATGHLDPRFPTPGYTDPRRRDPTRDLDRLGWPTAPAGAAPPGPDRAGGREGAHAGGSSSGSGARAPAGSGTPSGTPAGSAPTQSGRAGASAVGPDDAPARTDAQRLAHERGISIDARRATELGNATGLVSSIRTLLAIKTNTVLIVASTLGYFYLAGIETFAIEFTKDQYGINQAVANLLLLVVGLGAVAGVLVSGPLSDRMLRNGRLGARVSTTAVLATLAVVFFVPALLTRNVTTAVPYVTLAAFALSAQNPPIDAARLDIVPARLWGRAEGLRTALRTAGQAVAPVVFGGIADLFGGHRSGLQLAFLLMLIPLAGNAYVLFRARRTYPGDVATAAAASRVTPPERARGRRRRPPRSDRRAGPASHPPRPEPAPWVESTRSSATDPTTPGQAPTASGQAPTASGQAPSGPDWPWPAPERPGASWSQPDGEARGQGWPEPLQPRSDPHPPAPDQRHLDQRPPNQRRPDQSPPDQRPPDPWQPDLWQPDLWQPDRPHPDPWQPELSDPDPEGPEPGRD